MANRNRVVVITGASAGVGRATAREFASRGYSVGLIARGRERLAAAQAECERLGVRAFAVPCDVADPGRVEEAAELIEQQLGPIDVWVNNAMVSVFAPVREMTAVDFRRVTEVTYLGYVHGTLSALRRMLPRDRGVIIQVGSALAVRSIPLQSAYCAAKHAIRGFTESLRTELLHDKSRVKAVQIELPAVNTPQFDWVKSRLPNRSKPVPPIFQPEVPARAIAWLAEHPRRDFWLGFPTVKAILAERLIPGLADRYLGRAGYRSQQTDERRNPADPVNLFHPPAGDPGAHGRFDELARAWSAQFLLSRYRNPLLLAALGLLIGAGRSALSSRAPARSRSARSSRKAA